MERDQGDARDANVVGGLGNTWQESVHITGYNSTTLTVQYVDENGG
jgi:hypothetical protein